MTVHFSDKEGSFEDECSPNPTEEESQFHILDLVISLFFSLKSVLVKKLFI